MAETARKLIFISYRQHDAGSRADLLAELLQDALDADVFHDRRPIALGEDVTATIEAPLRRADVVLALIGEKWFKGRPGDKLRLAPIQRENDFVRKELGLALRGQKTLIPVYLDGVDQLVAEELPDDIKALVQTSTTTENLPSVGARAVWLREGYFPQDVEPLIRTLIEHYGFPRKGTAVPTGRSDQPLLKKYLSELIADLAHIQLPVADEKGRQSLPFSAVDVPMRLRRAEHVPGDPETTWENLLSRERVALTGDAGSGKSTLLRHIALELASNRLQQLSSDALPTTGWSVNEKVWAGVAAKIPILLRLPRVADPLLRSVKEGLEAVWDDRPVDRLLFTTLFDRGEILFLCDGLDEVANRRQELLGSIGRLQRLVNPVHGSNSVIVTCRDAAWGGSEEYASFQRVRIQPMDRETMEEYLGQWCRALWKEQAEPIRLTLTRSLRRSQATAEIGGNPQIAAILATVKHDAALPRQQAVLYEYLINRMIRTRDADAQEVLWEQLMAIAVDILTAEDSDGTPVIEMDRASTLLGRRSAASDAESAIAVRSRGERLLNELVISTGVLDLDPPRGLHATRYVRFKHRTFQEYLAARHFADLFVSGHQSNPLHDHVTDPGWAKVLAFTSGVLATLDEDHVKAFLSTVLGAPAADGGRPPTPGELAEWAPRVAAASICLAELATYDMKPQTLEPARKAHEMIIPLLSRTDGAMDVRMRSQIAHGFGAIDPRLDPAARWVVIPAGPFVRGASAEDAWIQEHPCTPVELFEYWIQRWPVTVAEYRVFIEDANGYQNNEWWHYEDGRRWRDVMKIAMPDGWQQNRLKGNCPVTGVSWWEADAFCRWSSTTRHIGLPAELVIQLPAESQWEKAARGGFSQGSRSSSEDMRFPWGSRWKIRPDDEDCANCSTTGLGAVVPVGLFPAGHSQPYGLWDLAGNVWERCFDGFAPYLEKPGTDPVCFDYHHGHVVRGGAFDSSPLNLRISYRFGTSREARDERTGFRCVAVHP